MARRITIWIVAILIVAGCTVLLVRALYKTEIVLQGVTLTQDADPRKQVPISNVEIIAQIGDKVGQGKSDALGAFRLRLPRGVWRNETVDIQFRRTGFEPVTLEQPLRAELYVVRMKATKSEAAVEPSGEQTTLKDVRIRYATKASTPINVGSIVKTFEVVNTGDLPCDRTGPCSPDHKWKAAIGGFTQDAGEGHEFRNVRTSCIAGPCPFTKIESGTFSPGGRTLKVSVLNWSDTVTYLVEAEVIQTTISDLVRDAYPAIFGREMSFTLPPTTQGPSIEADTNGTEIVYPLGPDLTLSWAVCEAQVDAERTKLYHCELKPGYRFQ